MEPGVLSCSTYGEKLGLSSNGQLFVACHECNHPICRHCVDYEIKEGRTPACSAALLIIMVRAREGESPELAAVDFFVSTVDPSKELPLITANTILSILALDYPVDKVSCYVSDVGAAVLTFESLAETADFARKWVPFCKKYSIEPRSPEFYFSQKIDYLKDKIQLYQLK